jgi:hypothetical protein
MIVALLAAEGLARLWAPSYLLQSRGLHVFSRRYGWTPRTDVSGMVDGKRISFDANGHRVSRQPVAPHGRSTRVVVLGDSIAFGLDVSDEEAFPSLMAARDGDLEVLNLAVQGYGPDQQLLVLVNEGLRHRPHVAILAFCVANDFAEAALPVALYDGRTPKPRFRLEGERLVLEDAHLRQSSLVTVTQWLGDQSHLLNRLRIARPRSTGPSPVHWRERKQAAMRDEDHVLRLTVALVARMDEACRQRGISFLVAVFPSRATYRGGSWLVDRFLESLAGQDVRALDMAPRFRERGLTPEAIFLDDLGHLNPRGHEEASRILGREVASHRGSSAEYPAPRQEAVAERTSGSEPCM